MNVIYVETNSLIEYTLKHMSVERGTLERGSHEAMRRHIYDVWRYSESYALVLVLFAFRSSYIPQTTPSTLTERVRGMPGIRRQRRREKTHTYVRRFDAHT